MGMNKIFTPKSVEFLNLITMQFGELKKETHFSIFTILLRDIEITKLPF